MDTGWHMRLAILKKKAENNVIEPLRLHGWESKISAEREAGEYVLIESSRAGKKRCCAILYSSATNNDHYKLLDSVVDVIFVQGDLYKLEKFAWGISKPVYSLDEFQRTLVDWNRETSNGKFATDFGELVDDVDVDEHANEITFLLSETPIEAIWLRLRQLESIRLAEKLVASRAKRANVELTSGEVNGKAVGVAFALRNASDYFSSSQNRNVSQRILNLYYGSMAFAFAEILAAPQGAKALGEIESQTKSGHGLYSIDGTSGDLADIVVGAIDSGFFGYWMAKTGEKIEGLPKAKLKSSNDLEGSDGKDWLTLEALFARIPEVSDLFLDIFQSPLRWIEPSYDSNANSGSLTSISRPRVSRTYGIFTDASGRQSKDDIASYLGPISEIRRINSLTNRGRYRVAIDHQEGDVLWDALKLHKSPLGPTALISPIFGSIVEYRAICFVLLYALSIIVRYRPSIWQRVQQGDLDHMRVLIEAFLAIVERVLPQHFLAGVSGKHISAKQPGALF